MGSLGTVNQNVHLVNKISFVACMSNEKGC